jgi:SAM-dependent methyltransferase
MDLPVGWGREHFMLPKIRGIGSAMKTDLLEVLVCPRCGEGLKLAGETTLVCGEHAYPLVDGVPDMLLGRESAPSREAFSQQWRYRYAGAFERENRVFWLGVDDSVQYLQERVFTPAPAGAWLLDAGCGSGEKAIALARANPQAKVLAMDFSDTLGELARQAWDVPNLHVVRGDVSNPPLKPGAFARIASIGVLHHTPDARAAFDAVAALAAPDAQLAVWLYPHPDESPAFQQVYYFVRDVLFLGQGHAWPAELRLLALRLLCLPVFALLPLFLASKAINRELYRDMTIEDLYRGLVFLLYDDLAPKYQSRHPRAEVEGWFRAHGFDQVENPELGLFAGRKEL